MRPGLIACAVLLGALPADGNNALLSPPVERALTLLDATPSKAALSDAFGTPAPLDNLLAIASDPTVDLGIELRAIHALPAYCPPAPQTCGPGTVVHDGLIALIDSYQVSPHAPQDLLRLRAAVEALGDTRSGLASDVSQLLPLLGHGSRDVRATVVRALRNICNSTAIDPLRTFSPTEPTKQVQLAIAAAVQDLGRCAN
jgi:hypothetical protein